MSTYTGSAFATKYAAYLIYKGSATAAALNISQPKIGYVYDITEGGTLTPGNITVQQGDAVVYLAQGWTHCNNGGADQAIADLSSQLDELIEEIGETDFSKFALKTELPTVPTNVSAFTNDAGYLTQHQSLANYALKTEIPNVSNLAPYSAIPQNVSQLTNDAHYLTEAVLNDRVRKVDDLAQDTDATDGEIVQLTTDGRFYRFTEPQADGESGTWTTINQPADIASDDQILSQNNSGKLTATLGMSYNSTNQHLELKGINDAVVAYVDMAVFIKDGMLENVEKYTTPEQGVTVAVPYLKFTFNTDSGKSVIRISFADLIDTFDGSNVDLTSAFVKAATYSAPAIGDSMDVAIGKLLKGHEDNAAAIATKQGTLTFDDAPITGSNNPVKSGGIKTAIDAVAASAAQGLKCVDLTTYSGGVNGEIVKHTGADTAQYTNGWEYKYTSIVIPSGSSYIDAREMTKYEGEIPLTVYLYQNTTNGKWWIYSNPSEAQKVSGFVYAYNDDYMHVGALVSTAAKIGTAFKQVVGVVTAVSDAGFTYEYDGESVTIPYSNRYGSSSYDERHLIDIFNPSTLLYLVNSNTILMSYDGGDTFEMLTYNNSHFADIGYMSSASSDIDLGSGWQQWNSQPSSASDVAALQTRMTAAETAISGKQDSLTFDNAPTANSGNVVKSGGVKSAIDFAPRFYLGTCSTAGNVAIKQVDIPNFPTQLVNGVETPIVGSVIAVKFQYTSEATSSQKYLKVNNTNAYPFWYGSGEMTYTDGYATICGYANRYVYYIFNGTHWVWVSHGSDNDTINLPTLGFGYASCTTAAATTAKTASLSNYILRNGGLVVVYFQYAVPAQSTLNINNTGAQEIHFGSSRIAAGVIKAGDKCLFIYNGNYMLIAIDRWGKELQEKVSGINISETDFEALSTYEQGKLYFVYDNNS